MYPHDASNRVTSVTEGGGTSETMAYDKASNVTLLTDRNTSTITMPYDQSKLVTLKGMSLATTIVGLPTRRSFGATPWGAF